MVRIDKRVTYLAPTQICFSPAARARIKAELQSPSHGGVIDDPVAMLCIQVLKAEKYQISFGLCSESDFDIEDHKFISAERTIVAMPLRLGAEEVISFDYDGMKFICPNIDLHELLVSASRVIRGLK
ncbi:MAG: hypothetical protein WCC57_01935 [Paracoccaceae bacterium]